MADTEQNAAQLAWPQRQFSQAGGQVLWPLVVVFVYSLIQLIRIGTHHNHYLFMIVGSVLGVVGLLAYIISSYTHGATGKKSIGGMLMALSGFLPFVFACYLIAYQGLWGFKELSTGFSIWLIIKAIVAILLGYKIIHSFDKVTQLAKSVKPTGSNISTEEQLDNLLATHGAFETALPIKGEAQQAEFVHSIDTDGVLNLLKTEQSAYKGKQYHILHFKNEATGQERSLFFDIT